MDLLSALSGLVVGLIANYFSPSFSKLVNKVLGWVANIICPDQINLAGIWIQEFEEPDPKDPIHKRKCIERINITQLGTSISGVGEIKGDRRTFTYSLTIAQSMIFGTYTKNGLKGNQTGHGMSQLIINPERTQMKGQATWFDADTQKIESSEVIWTRQ